MSIKHSYGTLVKHKSKLGKNGHIQKAITFYVGVAESWLIARWKGNCLSFPTIYKSLSSDESLVSYTVWGGGVDQNCAKQ